MLLLSKSLEAFNLETMEGHQAKPADCFCDEDDWKIDHFLAETGSWFSRREVSIVPERIYRLEISRGILHMDLDKTDIKELLGVKATTGLRSLKDMYQYTVLSKGESSGIVSDFIVQTDGWFVFGFIVESKGAAIAEKRIVPMAWVESVCSKDRFFQISDSRDIRDEAMIFSSDRPVNETNELRIYDSDGKLYSSKKALDVELKQIVNQ